MLRPFCVAVSSCQFTKSRCGAARDAPDIDRGYLLLQCAPRCRISALADWLLGLSLVQAGLLVCVGTRHQKFVPQELIKPHVCHYDRGSCLQIYRTVFPLATVTSCFHSYSYRKCQFVSSSTSENMVIQLHLLQSPATRFNRHTSSFAHRARFRRVHRDRQCNQGLIGNP